MIQYMIRRILLAIPTLLGLTLILFVLLRVFMPTDAVGLIASSLQVRDPELEERLRDTLGLDRSLPAQYVRWLGGALSGDFGHSFYSGRSVVSELKQRVPVSLELGLGALLVTLAVAVPVGVLSAVKQDTILDYASRGPAILIDVIPSFWIATLIIVYGSVWFGWAPSLEYRSFTDDPVANDSPI
jgi:peptide/nickel transport system permease protein